ncbi:PLC-like phosphodiesterase [Halteromyces radiatus]|uniref:PLC-like phosphodiesterase n=1 Tax=Halteromyces radiatus TaxID=101107 RepID=UPI00221F5071|nr:PLC-like phosphodiesterase [Halteromyces radiatus]KAI8086349.1 PLC-like phosphodiesterase [Halteromyces radiatus]
MYITFSIGTIITTLIAATSLTTSVSAQQACNGYSQLCSVPYHQVTTIVTHNSYSYMANPAANQACSVTTQLDDGVRGLKLSAVLPSNTTASDPANNIHLCHTSCTILDAGPAKDTLSQVVSWLKNNPNEVITIMWNTPNNKAFQPSDFNAIYQAAGMLDYVYTQPSGNNTWPTLQEMISSGKRVVTFTDLGADQSQVPWLLSEFDYVFETPYNNNNDTSFTCTIDRPADPSNPQSMMYVMNHFLYGSLNLGGTAIEIPQKGKANSTNSQSLSNQAQQCKSTFGRAPTFLEVDFYNYGNTLQIAAQLNNVTYTATSLKCNQATQSTGNGGSNGQSAGSTLTVPIFSSSILLAIAAILLF